MNLVDQIKLQSAVSQIVSQDERMSFEVDRNTLIEKDILFTRIALGTKTGIQELLKPQDNEMDGVRNISNAKLAGGTAFLVTGIVISHAGHSAVIKNEADLAKLTYSGEYAKADSSFFNNELSLKIGGKEKVKAALRHMMPQEAGDEKFVDSGYAVSPFLIPSNQVILPALNIYANPTAADKDTALEIALVGYRITANGK
ncbi:hypothetical protein DWB61_03750 [Ancylomarina euxinus]|uniref:Uncharacterized protein n=1 Tax=Ancylomarina euxinus TaxID=2283627 RepID=A0A425Y7B1_9BACT|nr:hypothetical protein [Ancylomarina euxinus]MBI9035473.1 hypothetical protein [Bacteroidales bacterium]MCZ4693884.1 hypothetical protein [Ancylomarina euxinus]MUP14696.1 hypothetical protein [Ancylomarina euxinus]RRG24240.1 hypothetical protein DWB61_03750 [Ancylomarina euxinus]